MKRIETSKGRFVVIDDKKETHYPFHMYIQLYGDNYYKLSEITEEEASGIVDINRIVDGKTAYKDYLSFRFLYKAIESLYSLLNHHNIEITPNTYIFKV